MGFNANSPLLSELIVYNSMVEIVQTVLCNVCSSVMTSKDSNESSRSEGFIPAIALGENLST